MTHFIFRLNAIFPSEVSSGKKSNSVLLTMLQEFILKD